MKNELIFYNMKIKIKLTKKYNILFGLTPRPLTLTVFCLLLTKDGEVFKEHFLKIINLDF